MSSSAMINPLSWDSAFFHLRIGKVDIETSTDCELLRKTMENGGAPFDLLYVFSRLDGPVSIKSAKLVDTKVVYRKKLTRIDQPQNRLVQTYENTIPDEELYRLALISGQYSRFNTDERFPAGSYDRLYRRWIEGSVNGQLADRVLCFVEGGSKLGFVTLKKTTREEGSIGLIAVDSPVQGRGVGTALIEAAERWFLTQGVNSMDVATQKDNVSACRFYRKCGFVQESSVDIYHLWL